MECPPYLLETLGDEESDTLIETAPGFLVDELDWLLESLPTAPVPTIRSGEPPMTSRSRRRSWLEALKRWFATALGASARPT